MNNINKPGVNPCSGCGMCKTACPHNAIAFRRDDDGFYSPVISDSTCTDCGICIKVCYKYLEPKRPFENTFKGKPVYGAWSKDIETVKASSSGGVGHVLTMQFMEQGYKICGCVFDVPNNICKHIVADNIADLEAIRTSKYLQSYTVDAFSQFVKDKRYLVIGTPCQIYGLRKWIEMKQWEENFVLVDFFCTGTPSFNLWEKYKEYLSDKHGLRMPLNNVNFRKKNLESKWHKNAISIQDFEGKTFEQNRAFSQDMFFRFFLNGSCLNNACYECKVRLDHCAADIRIADFWGRKYLANEWGVSLVIPYTERGVCSFRQIKDSIVVEECTYNDLRNSQGRRFITPNKNRSKLLKALNGKQSLDVIYRKHLRYHDWYRKSIVRRGFSYIKRRLLK